MFFFWLFILYQGNLAKFVSPSCLFAISITAAPWPLPGHIQKIPTSRQPRSRSRSCIYVQGGFFNWSALKMTKFQTLRKFWHLELFWRDLHVIWHLVIFRADQLKKPPCIYMEALAVNESYKWKWSRHGLVILFRKKCWEKVRVFNAISPVCFYHVQSLKMARLGRKYSLDVFRNLQ